MWVVDNQTPFAVERVFQRDHDANEVWVVAIKGTFEFRPDGILRCADEQAPPARAALWSGEPGKSSLLHDTDLVLSKRGTDVILRGHAYPPRGKRVTTMEVALRIGALAKRIRVFGVRAWMRASSTVVPGPARPIESVPICYEQAFGGTDPDAPAGKSTRSGQNPVGKGFTHRPADLLDTAAPQLEPIDGAPLRGGPFDVAPAGFGAIAPGWFPRARFAGTYDDAWKESRAPLLPRDFDERFYQVAPLDQQLPRPLPAGETIELFNLTPDGYLRLRTPDIQLQMRVIFRDGEERVGVTLHTVLLDPDARRVQMVWHGALACHGRDHKLRQAQVSWEGDRSCLSP